MTYPIKLKSSSNFIQEFYSCEYGRYEDAQNAREAGDQELIETNDYQVVACDFLERHKSVIEVRNDAELRELYYALASGTIGYRGRTAHANTLLDQIRERVQAIDPELVKQWPEQSGF